MKKSFALLTFLILGACAKERTTQQFQTQATGSDKPVVYVLENPNHEQQQLDLKNSPKVKAISPSERAAKNPKHTILMNDEFEQESLSKLYDSFVAESEEEIGPPEGVVCEFIPQARVLKTLGRLSCMKQTPATHYECAVDTTRTKALQLSDKTLYENLNIAEIEDAHGLTGYRTFKKNLGRLHCEKRIKIQSGAVSYECSAYILLD